MQRSLILLSFFLAVNVFAKSNIDLTAIFGKKHGCFILYDLDASKTVIHYNAKHCATRMPPCSTFKIALALMAFDRKIFQNENTVIKWDHVVHEFPDWNKDQTPKTWLQYSTVWVSQWITPQLGTAAITNYLQNFQYGNNDPSGGITKFWLSSTLKISADEQLNFLIRLWQNKLAVSPAAMNFTKSAIYAEKLDDNSIIYGKTGSGYVNNANIGWFVGYLSSHEHNYVFITNFISKADKKVLSGNEAKDLTKKILRQSI
jgi:beta-lactamase class D